VRRRERILQLQCQLPHSCLGRHSRSAPAPQAAGSFVYIFAGSLAIGTAFALAAALAFRSGYLRDEHAPVEAALVIIIAYCSFYLADGLECAATWVLWMCFALCVCSSPVALNAALGASRRAFALLFRQIFSRTFSCLVA
jgi:hypothetical protein